MTPGPISRRSWLGAAPALHAGRAAARELDFARLIAAALEYDAWATHAEIAWVAAERPAGPYRFRAVVLPARGGAGKDCIYYTGLHEDASRRQDRSPRVSEEDRWRQRNRPAIVKHHDTPSLAARIACDADALSVLVSMPLKEDCER